MTDPSQYFRGRTVQEQMNEVIGYVDTRSAEVATDAIAADVAQVHSDAADAHADALAAAASAAAAAGTLANAVKKTGEASQSIAGDIAVSGNLTGGSVTVPAPVNNTDAATKKYVDDQDALNVKLAGNQTVADVKTFSSSPVVPTVATGTADTKAANGTKVKNELDNYAPMVRTTGNQTVGGVKTLSANLNFSSNLIVDSTGVYQERSTEYVKDRNNADVALTKVSTGYNVTRKNDYIYNVIGGNTYRATLRLEIANDGTVKLLLLKDVNGTETSSVIATM